MMAKKRRKRAHYIVCLPLKAFCTFQMRQWYFRNTFVGTFTILMSLGNPEALNLLVSRCFGSLTPGSRFNAPITEKGIEKLHSVGLYANFLEDIPQLVIQVVCKLLTYSWNIVHDKERGSNCNFMFSSALIPQCNTQK